MGERNQVIESRLDTLRKRMSEAGADYLLIPTADYHDSEYVSPYFRAREYYSGFTGSAGTLLVWQTGAGLWTDGRYFIQAAGELQGTGIELFRMQEEGVPDLEDYIAEHVGEGQSLYFDGRTVTASQGLTLEDRLEDRGARIVCDRDIAGECWENRPEMPAEPLRVINEELSGRSISDKLSDVRERLKKDRADSVVISALDDIMWLMNIRGNDVHQCLVALSYAYVSMDCAVLFIQKKVLSDEAINHIKSGGVVIRDYSEIDSFIDGIDPAERVSASKRTTSYSMYKRIEGRLQKPKQLRDCPAPTVLLKARKNETELAHMREIYLKDSVAVTRFIYWLKTHIGHETITELSASKRLEAFRKDIPQYYEPSFDTIAAYGPNAAMMHYEPTPEHDAELRSEGFLLVDSGGQYRGGTTDVTRTIALGPLTDDERLHFTLTAVAGLRCMNARWLYGASGCNLDILARMPLWNIGVDYKCGTGHGVGYMLNVHEGPQSIHTRAGRSGLETPIEEGMDLTVEPGVYIEGRYGIRTENVVVAHNTVKNSDGQFMAFEKLTFVPIDLDAIDEQYMTLEDQMLLKMYHSDVYDKVSPYLPEDERKWLAQVTGVSAA